MKKKEEKERLRLGDLANEKVKISSIMIFKHKYFCD
jgi:hypothetical protein